MGDQRFGPLTYVNYQLLSHHGRTSLDECLSLSPHDLVLFLEPQGHDHIETFRVGRWAHEG
jgi:hypothetical protein